MRLSTRDGVCFSSIRTLDLVSSINTFPLSAPLSRPWIRNGCLNPFTKSEVKIAKKELGQKSEHHKGYRSSCVISCEPGTPLKQRTPFTLDWPSPNAVTTALATHQVYHHTHNRKLECSSTSIPNAAPTPNPTTWETPQWLNSIHWGVARLLASNIFSTQSTSPRSFPSSSTN